MDGEGSHLQTQPTNISLHGATSSISKIKITKTLRLSLDNIAEEWAQVPTPGNADEKESGKVRTMTVSVDEAFCHLRSSDLPNAEWPLQGGADRLRWSDLLHSWLRAPPKLDAVLKPEYDLVLAITQCSLDWSDSVHWRMLQTVYKHMMGCQDDCPQFGPHWMDIGFQGSDPSTDLRGVGMLGLTQLLYLSTGVRRPLAVRLLAVSRSRDQPFPLAVLSLNVTSIAVTALRAGRLNKECNSRHSVFDVINQFYAVIINYIYNVWTEEKKTLKDSGVLLKDAERYCNRHMRRLLRELPAAMSKHQ